MVPVGGLWRIAPIAAAVMGYFVAAASAAASPGAAIEVKGDGKVLIAGISVACRSGIRTILDAKLPNLGIATRNLLVMNPSLLRRHSDTVRLFVYHHECGHHHVGGDEIGADCWAVKAGVKAGWLTAQKLPEICRSFGNTPETRTHPASARRCTALQQCFSDASRLREAGARAAEPSRHAQNAVVQLVRGPRLLHEGELAQP